MLLPHTALDYKHTTTTAIYIMKIYTVATAAIPHLYNNIDGPTKSKVYIVSLSLEPEF
jgi:hypothetical protein